MKKLIALLAALFTLAFGAPASAQQSQWDGVARVVAMGDLHGEYDKFVAMLREADLIDEQGDWAGGRTHLVQLGDVPDRAPDSRRIMDLLMRLERQAQRAGGRVHALIGNHEAMNVIGDLRYVDPGEYAAFADRSSPRRRTQFYQRTLDYLRAHPPETGLPAFDDAFRLQWESEHPLGYVEHRAAWAPNGAYGRWVGGHNAIIRIDDTLYMHGGIGPSFAAYDRDAMNRAVRDALRGSPDAGFADILENQDGPLWYRGLAQNDEATETANLEAVLARHGVRRIVLGHTKAASTVLPRFAGRVILTDIAVPSSYNDPHAFLIKEGDVLTTMHRGQRVPLRAATSEERCTYLAAIAALDPPGSPNAALSAACTAPAP